MSGGNDGRLRSLGVRIASGIVYVAVLAACIMLGDITTMLLIMAIAALTSWEFFRMMRLDGKTPNERIGIVAAMAYPLVAYLDSEYLNTVTLFLVIALCIWYIFSARSRITDLAITLLGSLYTGLMLSAIVLIRTSIDDELKGAVLILGIFVSVWANDSFAFLFGSLFGKHKMAYRISPKKSWEGFFAGIVGSVAIWLLMTLIPLLELDVLLALVAGILCGVVGVIGDLVESRIKRGAGVKDSGTLIPGHGGMLDRTDSLIFVGITAYFVLKAGLYL